jgi:hypothetical protein
MAKVLKVGTKVEGVIKSNRGWKGVITLITKIVKKNQFTVKWENGQTTECTSRGIDIPGASELKKAKKIGKAKDSEPGDGDSESGDPNGSDDEDGEEEKEKEDEDERWDMSIVAKTAVF